MGWNTEENILSSATVSIELLREESNFSPIQTPSDLKERKSLIFEFPESNQHLNQQQQRQQQRLQQQHPDQSGIMAVLPQPDLVKAPKTIYSVGISKDEIKQQVVSELKRIAVEVFESPESCSSSGDVAGHLVVISKYLQHMSLDELKTIKEEILNANSHNEETRKATRRLFYFALSNVGSNPAIMLIKKDIESNELTGRLAANVLESAFRSIKTPTEDMLKELVQLVKNLKNLNWNEHQILSYRIKDISSLASIHMSKLFYRACIHPVRRMTEFPVRVYGHFCSNESRVITDDWIPHLKSEIESSSSRHQDDQQSRLTAITSLGKLGHINGLHTLVKVIDGRINATPLVRSVAVYSLKRVARLNPVMTKPILLSIIDNPAENTLVRIAAVSVLPWAQPSTAQLQKIAMRTWFEPSRQVAAFIYSTLKSLTTTEVPELKAVGLKASSVIQMAQPHNFGAQYSHNTNFADFVGYLKTAASKKISWVFNDENTIPSKIGVSNSFYNPSFAVRGLSYSIYTQGMDQFLNKILFKLYDRNSESESVREQLEKITEQLQIELRHEKSTEMFIQSRIAGFEQLYVLNKEQLHETIQTAYKTILSNPEMLFESRKFEYTRALEVFNIQTAQPTSAGFLRMRQTVMPLVFSAKGSIQGEKPMDNLLRIPTKVTLKLTPVFNTKVHTHVGVVCPFTRSFIGTGIDAAVHLATPVEVKVEVDHADIVSVKVKTLESLHKVNNH